MCVTLTIEFAIITKHWYHPSVDLPPLLLEPYYIGISLFTLYTVYLVALDLETAYIAQCFVARVLSSYKKVVFWH